MFTNNEYILKQTKIELEELLSDLILVNDYYVKSVDTFNSILGLNQTPIIKEEIAQDEKLREVV